MKIGFKKYQGAGNDFVLIDARQGLSLTSEQIGRICHRNFGVGGDGLMLLSGGEQGCDCTMTYYNSDGSQVEMCGNGARCFALFASHLGLARDNRLIFKASDAIHTAEYIQMSGSSAVVRIDIRDVEGVELLGEGVCFLNTGVPHYVEFVERVEEVDIMARGRYVRYDMYGEQGGANANFVEVVGEGHIRIRTYERGVEGETLACGTGATAAAIATHKLLQGGVNNCRVDVAGGELQIDFRAEGERFVDIHLTGPAYMVFEGEMEIF